MLLRPFAEADIEAARVLWQGIPGIGLSAADEPAALRLFLRRNPGSCFVATAEGQLVGTILCGHDGRRGSIHHLAVAPALQGQGLGRRLLEAGLAALRSEGIQKCHLMVFLDNAAGQAFWQAVGAQPREALALYSIDL